MRRNRRQDLENLQHPPGVYQHLYLLRSSCQPTQTWKWPILNIAATIWTDIEVVYNDDLASSKQSLEAGFTVKVKVKADLILFFQNSILL